MTLTRRVPIQAAVRPQQQQPASALSVSAPLAVYGTIIHPSTPHKLEIIENGLVIVDKTGTIVLLARDVSPAVLDSLLAGYGLSRDAPAFRELVRGQFLIPGFVDTHNHAPQWTQRGLGRGQDILAWLNNTTFPHEARFADPDYARATYASCVDGFLRQGVTTAAYYGSIHAKATKILADTCLAKGQRALVGRCNMNRNAPAYYRDVTAEASLQDTEDVVAYIRQVDPEAALVAPILTPRFAIACDGPVLAGLGSMAARNPDLRIQTHFNETPQEMALTKKLFPQFACEADLYQHFGLLTPRTILAHSIYMDDYEIGRLQALGCGVAHCPVSNTTGERFGMAPVRTYLERGMKVGLGTDSGGGFSSSIMDAMRQAFVVSKARETETKYKQGAEEQDKRKIEKALTHDEMLYLATLGGARVCGLDHKIGTFAVGKEFDALEIRTIGPEAGTITMIEGIDSTRDILEKFIMSGDDRNIARVFVNGRCVRMQ